DQNSSDQIEDVYAMLSEMGINVIESEEAEEADNSGDDESDSRDLAESGGTAVATKAAKEPTDR
ncbi:MAG: hypothetical protein KDJ88_16465, partial [Bauldia sp.]|nr:hypothetical protein [Bauldia sp.]